MKCPKCEGKGFIEYEAGTIMVKCEVCGGTGEIDDNPKYLLIPTVMPDKTIDETADIYRKIIKASKELDDSNSGARPDNSTIGSADTSQSRKLSKPKARKKTRKRAS